MLTHRRGIALILSDYYVIITYIVIACLIALSIAILLRVIEKREGQV